MWHFRFKHLNSLNKMPHRVYGIGRIYLQGSVEILIIVPPVTLLPVPQSFMR